MRKLFQLHKREDPTLWWGQVIMDFFDLQASQEKEQRSSSRIKVQLEFFARKEKKISQGIRSKAKL